MSTNTGSLAGGTYLTIQGPYLYTDSNVPADIRIGGKLSESFQVKVLTN